jgi:hypothetical protein
MPAPFKEVPLRSGDVLIVRTTPEDLMAIREQTESRVAARAPLWRALKEKEKRGQSNGEDAEQFVQAIVAPESIWSPSLSARSIQTERFGALVISLWRKDGWLDKEMSK